METEIRKSTIVVDGSENRVFCPIRNSFCVLSCVMLTSNGCTFPNAVKPLHLKQEIQEVIKPLYRTV